MMWKIFFIALMAAGVLAQLPTNIEQNQHVKDYLKQLCEKNGVTDKLDTIEKAPENFLTCVKELFDVETIKKEIEDAKPNGELDEVFKKYCAKSPQLKTCIHTLLTTAAPCLEVSLRERIDEVNNATDHLIDFVCYKDGDRIALFIAEGGPECFQEKANSIRDCATKLNGSAPSVDAIKSMNINEQCKKFEELTTCVVKALEECSTPTPGNMAESLVRFVRKGSPCSSVPKN